MKKQMQVKFTDKDITFNPVTDKLQMVCNMLIDTVTALQKEVESNRRLQIDTFKALNQHIAENIPEYQSECTCKEPIKHFPYWKDNICCEICGCGKKITPLPSSEVREKPLKGSYFFVTNYGCVVESPKSARKYESRKKWGNCFSKRSEAELALKRIKAVFKRIKS